MLKLSLLFFLFQIAHADAFTEPGIPSTSQECSRVDVSGKLGPGRDQLFTPWCYANAAADAASYALGIRVSASDIAVTFDEKVRVLSPNHFRLPVEETGGNAFYALKLANEKGFCPQAAVSDNPTVGIPFSDWDHNLHGSYCGDIKDLDCMVNQIRLLKLRFDEMGDYAICENKPGVIALRNIFPSLVNQNLRDVLRAITATHTIVDLTDLACKGARRKIPNLSVEQVSFNERSCVSNDGSTKARPGCVAAINEQLTIGNPVILGGSISYLFQKAFPFQLNSRAGHNYLLTGREFRHGVCGFIIRNSWGKECPKDLAKSVECSPESGNYWVDEATVLKETEDASWIKM